MPFTQTQLDALNAAIALGVKKVKYGDKETEYQSLGEMLQLRSVMQTEISGVSSLADRRTVGIFRSTNNKT